MKNVILYARVSTQKQSGYGESLNIQISTMRKYAESMKWNVIGEFQEQFTGTKDDRPELNRAMETIEKLKENNIITTYFLVHKIDRNSRAGPEVHFNIKNKLKKLGVELRDAQGVIQEEKNIVEIDGVDTYAYDWANINPSENNEMILAMSAKHERNAILQRTIPQEIRNSLEGYWTRPPNFGFDTKKIINTAGSRRTIQVKNDTEARWVIRMFDMRIEGYKDTEIVEEVNELGYQSRFQVRWNSTKTQAIGRRGGNKLNIKQLRAYIENPIYAGIGSIKWKGNEKINVIQKYPGLVSLETWNRANKGKKRIIIRNEEVQILADNESMSELNIKRRFRDNPSFPFGRLVFADESTIYLNGNSPKGKTGKRYAYYSAKINKKCVSYGQEIFESTILQFFSEIEADSAGWKNLYIAILEKMWAKRGNEISSAKSQKQELLHSLIAKKRKLLEEVSAFISFPAILLEKNKELELLQENIQNLEGSITEEVTGYNFENLKKYGQNLVENIGKIASNTKDHRVLKLLFQFVFIDTPTFSQIANRNPNIYPFFGYRSQQKILQGGEFDGNTGWQLRRESNPDRRIWSP